MLLPYDIFSNIIPFSDMKTIFNLYHTDKKLRELCLNDKFGKVLIRTSFHPYFNLNSKSNLLNQFLNDICDTEMLNKLQSKLASSLINKLTIIIINSIEDNVTDIQSDQFTTNKMLLHGSYNGKTTLIQLLRKLDIYIDVWQEENDDSKLFNIKKGNIISYKCIIKTDNPMTKFKFKNFVMIEDMIDLLWFDQDVLSSLLNFLLDGYRKSLV